MKNTLFSLLAFFMLQHTQAQTTIKLRNEAGTAYTIAGKLISNITVPSKEVLKTYLAYNEKDKTYKITCIEHDAEGVLSSIVVCTLPTAAMNFQTDGYGSRVEEEENDFFGAGKVSKIVLLCKSQSNCFTEEKIDVQAEEESKKINTSYATLFFTKKTDAQDLLKEIVSKK